MRDELGDWLLERLERGEHVVAHGRLDREQHREVFGIEATGLDDLVLVVRAVADDLAVRAAIARRVQRHDAEPEVHGRDRADLRIGSSLLGCGAKRLAAPICVTNARPTSCATVPATLSLPIARPRTQLAGARGDELEVRALQPHAIGPLRAAQILERRLRVEVRMPQRARDDAGDAGAIRLPAIGIVALRRGDDRAAHEAPAPPEAISCASSATSFCCSGASGHSQRVASYAMIAAANTVFTGTLNAFAAAAQASYSGAALRTASPSTRDLDAESRRTASATSTVRRASTVRSSWL